MSKGGGGGIEILVNPKDTRVEDIGTCQEGN